ncbi:MAG: hypothetical protein ACKO1L_07095 [Brachymonas sp.]
MAAAARKPPLDLTPAQEQARVRARALLSRRALVAAAAGAVPVPGLDWAVDAALLSKLLPQISQEFGLSPTQIAQLSPKQRERVQIAISLIGGTLVGKFLTKELLVAAAKAVGVRLTAAQAAKFVPLAGTVISASLNYAAVRWLGEQHIKDCLTVVQQAQLILPAPASRA